MIGNNIYLYLTAYIETSTAILLDRFEREIESSSDLRGIILITIAGLGLIAVITILAIIVINSFRFIVSSVIKTH